MLLMVMDEDHHENKINSNFRITNPGVASSLLTLRLVFCGYYLLKLPVEDL